MRLYNPRLVFFYQALLLVALSGALGWLANEVRPDGLSWLNTPQETTTADMALETASDIDLEEAMRLHSTGEAVFVDARHQADYVAGHIPGAVNVPLGMFEDEIEAVLSQYGKEAKIVVYCSSITCGMAQELALALGFMEYSDVSVFAGGMEAWTQAGGEIESVIQTGDQATEEGQGDLIPVPAELGGPASGDAAAPKAPEGGEAQPKAESGEVAQ